MARFARAFPATNTTLRPPALPKNVSVVDDLAGGPIGVAKLSAGISIGHLLSTGLTGVAVLGAGLSVTHNLGTGPTGVAKLGGGLSVTHSLATSPIGIAILGAPLALTHNLSTSPIGVAQVGASASITHNLVINPVGVAVIGGNLTVVTTVNLVGSIVGSSLIRGALAAPVTGFGGHREGIASRYLFTSVSEEENFFMNNPKHRYVEGLESHVRTALENTPMNQIKKPKKQ